MNLTKCSRKRRKIAVLGNYNAIYPNWEQLATVKDLVFVSALETAKKYVPEMHGVTLSVDNTEDSSATFHVDPTELLTRETKGMIATQVEGIDALVTGHQHRDCAKVNGVPVIQPDTAAHMSVKSFRSGKVTARYSCFKPKRRTKKRNQDSLCLVVTVGER